jgi:UDP-N-acetylmuramyl pentapeptide phosphotransferase/UDP-N-acetylglucosamine-1-phosphate transferase
MRWLDVIVMSLGAMLTSYIGVGLIRRWAASRMLDIPNERSSHTRPTPRGGGLAIVAVTLVGGSFFVILYHSGAILNQWLYYCAGALLIGGVSFLDDFRSLPRRARFAVHLAGALIAIAAFGVWNTITLPGIGTLNLGWLAWPITIIWIVGLTNAYNFMDGIDGIAAGQGIVAGIGWGIIGLMSGNQLVGLPGALLAATCLGFLCHNWPPARIFMGDVGSAFLGYTFAVLPVIAANQIDPRLAFVGILFVWPFVFDSVFTFLRRLLNHENVFEAHRSHLYQRLVTAGYSHGVVSMWYICLAGVGVALGVWWGR